MDKARAGWSRVIIRLSRYSIITVLLYVFSILERGTCESKLINLVGAHDG